MTLPDLTNLVVLLLHLEVILPGLLEQLDQQGCMFSGGGGPKSVISRVFDPLDGGCICNMLHLFVKDPVYILQGLLYKHRRP